MDNKIRNEFCTIIRDHEFLCIYAKMHRICKVEYSLWHLVGETNFVFKFHFLGHFYKNINFHKYPQSCVFYIFIIRRLATTDVTGRKAFYLSPVIVIALNVLIVLRQGAETALEPSEKFSPGEGTTDQKEAV